MERDLSGIYERFAFRPVKPEEAEEAAEIEWICFPPHEAVPREDMIERALKVPEDLSVVGFDDGYIGTICTPKLTTIHQSAEEKGRIAAEQLLLILKGGTPKLRQQILEPSLVVRDSVKQCP